jgi:hypothetical protein
MSRGSPVKARGSIHAIRRYIPLNAFRNAFRRESKEIVLPPKTFVKRLASAFPVWREHPSKMPPTLSRPQA